MLRKATKNSLVQKVTDTFFLKELVLLKATKITLGQEVIATFFEVLLLLKATSKRKCSLLTNLVAKHN